MNSTIRPAREDDARFLAWTLQESARSHLDIGIWDVLFPGPEEQRLDVLSRLTRTSQLHYAHYPRFLILERAGEPAAALSAYESAEFGSDKLNRGVVELFEQLQWGEEKLVALAKGIAPYQALGYPNPEGLWIVEWVATWPAHRGQGLIRELLEAILQKGRDEGFHRSQIGYLLGNIPAKSAYEGVGFGWVDEHRHPAFEEVFGTPGIARMQRDL